mgnify:CR=1 FL=1
MELLIVRHAPAGNRSDFAKRDGRPDRERPLTHDGRRKFKRSAKALKRIFPGLRLIATSPFTRAAQTAHLLHREHEKARLVVLAPLAHGGSASHVTAWLGRQRSTNVAVVGHEPDLGRLIGLLTKGRVDAPVTLKKGGAALVSFEGKPAAGAGTLLWVVTPGVLKRLG